MKHARPPQPAHAARLLQIASMILIVATSGRLMQRNGLPAFPPRTVLSNVSEAPPTIVDALEVLPAFARLVPPGTSVMVVEPEHRSFEFILYAIAFSRLPGRHVLRGQGDSLSAAPELAPQYVVTIGTAPLASPGYFEVATASRGRLYVRQQ